MSKSHKHKHTDLEKQIKFADHMKSFAVSTTACIFYYMYNSTSDYFFINITTFLVALHCGFDIFYTDQWDHRIHHVFVLSFFYYKYFMHSIPHQEDAFITVALMATELSSPFYNFARMIELYPLPLIPKSLNKYIIFGCDLSFAALFYYTRVINFNSISVTNPDTHILLARYNGSSYLSTFLIYYGLFGLGLLNMYWFTLILRKLSKLVGLNNSISQLSIIQTSISEPLQLINDFRYIAYLFLSVKIGLRLYYLAFNNDNNINWYSIYVAIVSILLYNQIQPFYDWTPIIIVSCSLSLYFALSIYLV